MSDLPDPNFYTNGAKKMVAEGIEVVSKIMAFMKENQAALSALDTMARKKAVLAFEPSKMFNQIHPIVFQYLAAEGIFNAKAFRRYVYSVYGKPKTQEDQERMRRDRRYVYHYKNAQQALYYKYLLCETNSNVNTNTIHDLYEKMVKKLNADTDRMLEAYKEAEAEAKITEARLNEEKRKDLVKLLKTKLPSN
jgi:hypothetical protein